MFEFHKSREESTNTTYDLTNKTTARVLLVIMIDSNITMQIVCGTVTEQYKFVLYTEYRPRNRIVKEHNVKIH